MATPCSNFKNTYYDIYKINHYFWENDKGQLVANTKCKDLIHKYCHYGNHSGNDNCRDYLEMTSSSVIYLLKHLKDKYKLEYDKLAEYAILWLSYKLNKSKKNTFKNLNEFYTKYIEKNMCYDKKITNNDSMTYKEIINTKKDLMDMNIKEISKFNLPFNILFYLYYAIHDEYWDYTEYPKYAINFANKFEELSKNSNNIENSSYNNLLSTLSNDYNNLKNICNHGRCTNFPSLPKIEPKKNSVEDPVDISENLSAVSTEATSSSSSILNTVIPGLSTFSVIPVFLGVAYKYSLFGIDKLFQRQYLRKNFKKIKKKMKLNI
ncbi:PIR protein CIR protein [Plasmodium vinckei vinckei]|uniref:PIR protein CIR protein n=1 Tax=Plasmodium vinckei vinckei TaxID=54757 RepID=A0A449BMP8_PLAVN|nr:PIR protein CIR protein [Plasmodium vinckei vinckei]VEV54727.1 PIR protein CIR protein [Plasmodium vinckei vinckei]